MKKRKPFGAHDANRHASRQPPNVSTYSATTPSSRNHRHSGESAPSMERTAPKPPRSPYPLTNKENVLGLRKSSASTTQYATSKTPRISNLTSSKHNKKKQWKLTPRMQNSAAKAAVANLRHGPPSIRRRLEDYVAETNQIESPGPNPVARRSPQVVRPNARPNEQEPAVVDRLNPAANYLFRQRLFIDMDCSSDDESLGLPSDDDTGWVLANPASVRPTTALVEDDEEENNEDEKLPSAIITEALREPPHRNPLSYSMSRSRQDKQHQAISSLPQTPRVSNNDKTISNINNDQVDSGEAPSPRVTKGMLERARRAPADNPSVMKSLLESDPRIGVEVFVGKQADDEESASIDGSALTQQTVTDGSSIMEERQQHFDHPPLPSGWVIRISRSKKRPYYSHPDFGTTWHCPVVIPEKSRGQGRKTRRRRRNRGGPSSRKSSFDCENNLLPGSRVHKSPSDDFISNSRSTSRVAKSYVSAIYEDIHSQTEQTSQESIGHSSTSSDARTSPPVNKIGDPQSENAHAEPRSWVNQGRGSLSETTEASNSKASSIKSHSLDREQARCNHVDHMFQGTMKSSPPCPIKNDPPTISTKLDTDQFEDTIQDTHTSDVHLNIRDGGTTNASDENPKIRILEDAGNHFSQDQAGTLHGDDHSDNRSGTQKQQGVHEEEVLTVRLKKQPGPKTYIDQDETNPISRESIQHGQEQAGLYQEEEITTVGMRRKQHNSCAEREINSIGHEENHGRAKTANQMSAVRLEYSDVGVKMYDSSGQVHEILQGRHQEKQPVDAETCDQISAMRMKSADVALEVDKDEDAQGSTVSGGPSSQKRGADIDAFGKFPNGMEEDLAFTQQELNNFGSDGSGSVTNDVHDSVSENSIADIDQDAASTGRISETDLVAKQLEGFSLNRTLFNNDEASMAHSSQSDTHTDTDAGTDDSSSTLYTQDASPPRFRRRKKRFRPSRVRHPPYRVCSLQHLENLAPPRSAKIPRKKRHSLPIYRLEFD